MNGELRSPIRGQVNKYIPVKPAVIGIIETSHIAKVRVPTTIPITDATITIMAIVGISIK